MLVKKLGQPVPDSYFISEVNRGRPQPAQTNTPARFSSLSALVPARSVLSSRSTRNASAGRRLRHSSFDSLSGSPGEGTAAPAGTKLFQFFCSSSMPFMLAGGAAYAAREAKALATRVFSKVRRSILVSFRFDSSAGWSREPAGPDKYDTTGAMRGYRTSSCAMTPPMTAPAKIASPAFTSTLAWYAGYAGYTGTGLCTTTTRGAGR